MPTRTAEAEWKGDLIHGKGHIKLGSGAFEGSYDWRGRSADGAGTNPEELIGSGNDQLLCIGDATHHNVLMFAHPEWTVAFDTDPQQAIAARKRLFDRASADRTLVLGNHIPFPGLGHIKKQGSGYEWITAPWVDA